VFSSSFSSSSSSSSISISISIKSLKDCLIMRSLLRVSWHVQDTGDSSDADSTLSVWDRGCRSWSTCFFPKGYPKTRWFTMVYHGLPSFGVYHGIPMVYPISEETI
jgi:hypothetical protein